VQETLPDNVHQPSDAARIAIASWRKHKKTLKRKRLPASLYMPDALEEMHRPLIVGRKRQGQGNAACRERGMTWGCSQSGIRMALVAGVM